MDDILKAHEEVFQLMKHEDIQVSILRLADIIYTTLEERQTIFVCGNGGSSADASHFAAEMIGRFVKERKPYKVIALGTDAPTVTALANDYGYERVFSRQLEGLGTADDVLLCFSTSGKSANVISAVGAAKAMGMTVAAVTGAGTENLLFEAADHSVVIPSTNTARIQEMTAFVTHAVCQILDEEWLKES